MFSAFLGNCGLAHTSCYAETRLFSTSNSVANIGCVTVWTDIWLLHSVTRTRFRLDTRKCCTSSVTQIKTASLSQTRFLLRGDKGIAFSPLQAGRVFIDHFQRQKIKLSYITCPLVDSAWVVKTETGKYNKGWGREFGWLIRQIRQLCFRDGTAWNGVVYKHSIFSISLYVFYVCSLICVSSRVFCTTRCIVLANLSAYVSLIVSMARIAFSLWKRRDVPWKRRWDSWFDEPRRVGREHQDNALHFQLTVACCNRGYMGGDSNYIDNYIHSNATGKNILLSHNAEQLYDACNT